jgi:xylulokinase
MTDYVIGIDIGTQSTKALLCAARGRIVAQWSESYQPDTPAPMWAEQWPQVWLDATLKCIAGCVRAAGEREAAFRADAVRAICISSLYGGSGIPVDEAMTPLHPALIWLDRRANDEADWVRAHAGHDGVARLEAITGNGIDSFYGFTKMLWLKNHRPQVWANTRWLVPPNAFVVWHLTGALAVDRSAAGNIGGVYDWRAATWSGEMLDLLGIPRTMMPERLVASHEIVGKLTPEAGARVGLPAGVPVLGGGVDAAMATFAAGVTRRGQHVAMIGTSMCWGFITREVDPKHGLVSMPYVFGAADDLYVFGGASTAGGTVTWFRELLRGDDAASSTTCAAADPADLATLEAGARDIPAGAEGLVFLPYLMGERSPIWDGRASGAFVGLTLYHKRTHLYRAILEGVAYALRHNMDAGMRGAAALDEALIVVGGAAKSDLWMQIIADVVGRPVLTIEEEVEATMGDALLAAYAVGLASEDEVRDGWVTLRPRARPRAETKRVYDTRYAAYLALYPALKDIMHSLRG